MIRHRLLCLGYFDFGSVGLFSLGFLSLFAVQTQHGQNTAADEQSSQPTDEVAAVTGLRRLGGVVLSWLTLGYIFSNYSINPSVSQLLLTRLCMNRHSRD